MNNLTKITIVLFLIAMIIAWPLLIAFALNTLFVSLSIPYTFWTWLSVTILQASTFGGIAAAIRNLKN